MINKCSRISLATSCLLLIAFFSASAQTLISAAGKTIIKSLDGGQTWKTVWDGTMESKVYPMGYVTSVVKGNGKIVVSGETMVVSDDNGKTWKEISIVAHTGGNLLTKYTSPVGYGDGLFVLAIPFHVLYSTDGYNWKYVSGGGSETKSQAQPEDKGDDKKKSGMGLGKLKSLANDPKSAAKNTSGSESSSGSSSSSKSQANPAGLDNALDIVRTPHGVNFFNGKFFITGGNMSMEMATLVKEGDELKLEKKYDLFAEYGNAATLTTGGLCDMATDGKVLVVAASGSKKSGFSDDGGKTWKFFFNPSQKQTNSVAYGNGLFVTVNGFGECFYSSDITEGAWSGQSRFSDKSLEIGNKIIFDGTKFIVSCHSKRVFTSTDAINWTSVSEGEKSGEMGVNMFDIEKID